ncbi:hypothetical protein LTS18_007749 [Coniosporium uncinatum]|uniref:Uncharacterized protein n=1 Tax=Coniosporium uncinatum TaxID=93489 RepID=A0ACC3D2L1_9PEZI|nr:hypothetical protein LTS18_007749 [Coniosporium uncinatum]
MPGIPVTLVANLLARCFNSTIEASSRVQNDPSLVLASKMFHGFRKIIESHPDFVLIPQSGPGSILLAFIPEQCRLFAASLPAALAASDCEKLDETNKLLLRLVQKAQTTCVFPFMTLKSCRHPLYPNGKSAFTLHFVDDGSFTTVEQFDIVVEDLGRLGRDYMMLECWRLSSVPLMSVMTMSVYQKLAARLSNLFEGSEHCALIYGPSILTTNSILTTPNIMVIVPDALLSHSGKTVKLHSIIHAARTYDGETPAEEISPEILVVPVSRARSIVNGACLTADHLSHSLVETSESGWASESSSTMELSEGLPRSMMCHIDTNKDDRVIFNVLTLPTLTVSEHRKFTEEVVDILRNQAEASFVQILSPVCDEEIVRGTGETAKQKFVRIALGNDSSGAKGEEWLGYEDRPDVVEYLGKMWDRQCRAQFKRLHVNFQFRLHAEIPGISEVYYNGAVALEESKAGLGHRSLVVCGVIWVVRKIRERVTQKVEAFADTVRGGH